MSNANWPDNYHQPSPQAIIALRRKAIELAQVARSLGMVLTIEQVPTEPLRMGGHVDKVTITPRRKGQP